VIVGWSINDPKYDNARLVKVWCNSTSTFSTSALTSNPGSITNDSSVENGTDDSGGGGNDVASKSDGNCGESTGQKCM